MMLDGAISTVLTQIQRVPLTLLYIKNVEYSLMQFSGSNDKAVAFFLIHDFTP